MVEYRINKNGVVEHWWQKDLRWECMRKIKR